MDNRNSWLTYVKFDWRHVMEAAIERNDQTRLFITFLCRLFYNFTNNEQNLY